MIASATIQNLGNIAAADLSGLSKINLVIGENDTGKTMLLKALYVLSRSLEEFQKGKDPRSYKEVLADKLYWTFQVEKIGELVSKDRREGFELNAVIDDQSVRFGFSQSAKKSIASVSESVSHRSKNSIFLPAKEVLGLFSVIKKSRGIDNEFGFDDTYYDLVKALEKDSRQGNNFRDFAEGKRLLKGLVKGRMEYKNGEWSFEKGKMKIPIHSTAEGIKKIAILDRLLSNRYITPGSIIYIDEPESVLHPKAIVQFLDIITLLANRGIQVFMATHSYFVLKKMLLVARENDMDIPVFSMANGTATRYNLKDGMPENPIVDTSIELYEQELDMELS